MARVLVTGANGYIGRRLIPVLHEMGHEVVAMVRDPGRLHLPARLSDVEVVVGDFQEPRSLATLPTRIDAVYYLIHSMAGGGEDFDETERRVARLFVDWVGTTEAKQVIYLGGLANDEHLSKHLASRREVEKILGSGRVPLTALRAGVIVGSGSASFEIMRDLVEKLPFMVAPKWIKSRCQPIAVYDVIHYLAHVLGNENAIGEGFDIGGPEILTYKELLERLARARGLHRYILTVPVLTPRLSSYWLVFVTATNYALARYLIDGLRVDVVCADRTIEEVVPHKCLSYEEAIDRAFARIAEHAVVSSWKDAWVSSSFKGQLADYVQVPDRACLSDVEVVDSNLPAEQVIKRVWSLGGKQGWLVANWAWKVRGRIDKMTGGVGLRRGRRSESELRDGDALDFWRVLLADKEKGRLLLYAEMKLPGEAWLEFEVSRKGNGCQLKQTATFRPRGLLGRLYWYGIYPVHRMIFRRMAKAIANPGQ